MSSPTPGSAAPADTPAPAMEPLSEAELDRLEALRRAAELAMASRQPFGPMPECVKLWLAELDEVLPRLLAQARRAASGSLPGGKQLRDAAVRAVEVLYRQGLNAEADKLECALSAPPPPAAEPVAWGMLQPNGSMVAWLYARKPELHPPAVEKGWTVVPLYTAPQPGGTDLAHVAKSLAGPTPW